MTAVASLTHVWVVVNHALPVQLQRSTELKISVSLGHQDFIFYQKKIVSKRFTTYVYFLLTHDH